MLALHPDDIEIGERQRALSDDAVERLAKSMADIGLRQPITVRVVEEMVVDGELTAGVPVLVVGAHRLAAAKKLGWDKIDCIEVADDTIEAELWEIAENLHRLDLTKEQRDEHIRRYAELLIARREAEKPGTVSDFRKAGAGRGNKGVAAEIAEKIGLSQRTVRDVLNNKPPRSRAEPPKEVFDVHEDVRRRLMSAWNAATEEDRQWFRDWIDGPIMDQRYG